MPRVLMTADTVGGVWTYAVGLARELHRRGSQVALATMGAPLSADQYEAADRAGVAGIFESCYKLEWMDEPWEDVSRAGQWLLDVERRFQPDVVHLNGYAHGALPWRAPSVMVGHSCVLSWWRAVRGGDAPESWDRYRQTVTSGVRSARLLIAPSKAMLRSIEKDYGPGIRGRVIPNAAPPRQARMAKEHLVFSAGRLWDEAKNVAALDEAAPGLDWPVYAAGDAGGRAGSMRHVIELGQLPHGEISRWLGRACIYALPARYEPFGLSILEAALAGCPLVLGDIESLRENWYDAALFVKGDDPRQLRAAIKLLIDDSERREKFARLARERARRFTPARMAQAYLAAYREAQAIEESPERR